MPLMFSVTVRAVERDAFATGVDRRNAAEARTACRSTGANMGNCCVDSAGSAVPRLRTTTSKRPAIGSTDSVAAMKEDACAVSAARTRAHRQGRVCELDR
jgi:hypothetical protein